MKQLKRIILINSFHSYQQLDLSSSIHLLGANGSGKSDWLALITAFYAGFHKKATPFGKSISYYLPRKNSWIIYEVQGKKGLFCLLFHRAENLTSAYFINGDFEEEVFFKKDKALSLKEVQAHIKSRKLHQAGPFDLEGGYQSILWGNYEAKDKSELRRYQLASHRHAVFLPELLSWVFKKGEIPFNTFKKFLWQLSGQESKEIDIKSLKSALRSFQVDRRSIRAFQDAESSLAQLLNYKNKEEELLEKEAALFFQLQSSRTQHRSQKQNLQREENLAKKQLKSYEDEIHAAEESLESQLKELYLQMGGLAGKLSLGREKQSHYEKQNIPEKIQEYRELSLRKRKEEALLFGEKENQKGAREELIFVQEKLKWEEELSSLWEKFLEKREKLLREWEERESSLEEEGSLLAMEEQIRRLQEEMDSFFIKKQALKLDVSEEKLEKMRRQSIQLLEDSIEYKLSIRQAEVQYNQLQKSREKEFEKWESEKKLALKNLSAQLKSQREELENVSSQIANSGRAFMGWLEKNYPDWQKSIGRLLKDEVLLNPFLSPGIERINELFYGIHLDLSELPDASLDIQHLQEEKSRLEKEVERLEKEVAKLEQKSQKQKDTREKYYRQKLREVKRKQQKDEYELQQLEVEIKRKETEIERLRLQSKQEVEAAHLRLSYQENELAEELKQLRQSYHSTKEKWDKERKAQQQAKANALDQWQKELAAQKAEIQLHFSAFEKEWKKKQPKKDQKGLGTDIFLWEDLDRELRKYEFDKVEYLEKIDSWERESAHIDFQIANKEAELKRLRQAAKRKKQLLEEQWGEAKSAWEIWEKTEESLNIWEKGKQAEKMKAQKSGENETDLAEIPLKDLLEAFAQIAQSLSHNQLKQEQHLREFLSFFSLDNSLNFPLRFETQTEKKLFIRSLVSFQQEDGFAAFLNKAQARHADLIGHIHKIIPKLEPELEGVQELLNTWSQRVKGIFPDHLKESSHFVISYSRKSLFELLRKIAAFYQQHRDDLGETSLFNQGDHSSLNTESFEMLEALDEVLQSYPEISLATEDILDLDWVDEHEKLHRDFRFLSFGISRAIHLLLASYMIQHILSQENELSISISLDDILSFDAAFLSHYQDMLKESPLYICSSSTIDSPIIEAEKIYQIRKNALIS
ncbi:MAG: ATP-binding protein [Bacteroidota bacterium]